MGEIRVKTDDLVSVEEAAKQLERPRSTVYRWVRNNEIFAIRLGGILFIPKSEVERLKTKGPAC